MSGVIWRRWSVVLWLLVMVSAVSVVYASHLCRQLYAQLALLQHQENRLQVEWGQYLLEQSTWASLARIEKLATEELGMRVPGIDEVIIVGP